MKKTMLLIGAFFCLLSLQAQFTVETDTGTPILDGDIFVFGQTHDPAKLNFHINNTSSSQINMLVECVSMTNTDGSMMEFCITPTCYFDVAAGEFYPHDPYPPVPIQPGGQSNGNEHFMNKDSGNGTDVIDYVFRFYQVNDFGIQIGTSLTMTYRYDPLLSAEEMNKLDITVYPTLVQDILTIETGETLNMAIYDLQGRLVKNAELSIGQHQIELSNLSGQMYLVRFENELGASQVTKVIVQ